MNVYTYNKHKASCITKTVYFKYSTQNRSPQSQTQTLNTKIQALQRPHNFNYKIKNLLPSPKKQKKIFQIPISMFAHNFSPRARKDEANTFPPPLKQDYAPVQSASVNTPLEEDFQGRLTQLQVDGNLVTRPPWKQLPIDIPGLGVRKVWRRSCGPECLLCERD